MMTLDNRHKLARPYWARPGIAFVTDPDESGGSDDDNLDDDDEDEDDDDEDDDDDPDEGKTPEELAAELKAARAAIARANGSSAKRRRQTKALKARIAELEAAVAKGGKGKADDDDAPDLDAVRREAERKATTAAHGRVIRAEARGALKALGVDPARVGKLVDLLDFDEIDVDEDGEVDGLDDAIDALKADYPELFAKSTRRRRSVSGPDDRDGERHKAPKITDASKLQAQQLLGRK